MNGEAAGVRRETGWLVCPDCESSCRDRKLTAGEMLRCRRCGYAVKKHRGPLAMQMLWALATAGLILAVLANVEPIMTFDVAGNTQTNRIFTGIRGLVVQGYSPVAALVGFGAIVGPLLHLSAVWYVAAACCLGRRWPGLPRMTAAIEKLAPWNLVIVFAVGVQVSVVKLDLLGKVEWRQGAVWILLLALCSMVTVQVFDRVTVDEEVAALG